MDNSVDLLHEDYATGDHSNTRQTGNQDGDEASVVTVLSYVKDMVKENKVVVFSKTQCPHCDDSKSLLQNMGVEYTSVELDKIHRGPQVQNVLGQITDARTVPRIFIGGQCVGGNSDLQHLNREGVLKDLLLKDE